MIELSSRDGTRAGGAWVTSSASAHATTLAWRLWLHLYRGA